MSGGSQIDRRWQDGGDVLGATHPTALLVDGDDGLIDEQFANFIREPTGLFGADNVSRKQNHSSRLNATEAILFLVGQFTSLDP